MFDRYHLMSYLGAAVDSVRKQENRALAAAGDRSLAGTKYLWLYAAENLPGKHAGRFASLKASDLKTVRAWAIKESLRHLWHYRRRGWAAKHFKRWYFWATHSKLQPVIDAAKTLKRHQQRILNYFTHPITNAGAEGLNSRVQAIRVSARGHRNREQFKAAIYFHLGGLQLYPARPSPPATHGNPGRTHPARQQASNRWGRTWTRPLPPSPAEQAKVARARQGQT